MDLQEQIARKLHEWHGVKSMDQARQMAAEVLAIIECARLTTSQQ